MKRNFDNFLDAYLDYADNKFAPRAFHLWSGLALIAAGLERKVWTTITADKNTYPNIYLFLVAKPAVGKSSAIDLAINFIRGHNKASGVNPIKMLSNQATEQKYIELMTEAKEIVLGTKIQYHSSHFFHASEASNTFKNIKGSNDLLSALTEFYDCSDYWEKSLVGRKDKIIINNMCLSLLAGCTFDFLGKLITSESIFGGFASRVIYIIHAGNVTREVKWETGDNFEQKNEMKKRLLEDYKQICSIYGKFGHDQSWVDLYNDWYPKQESERNAQESEKMQSLLARKPVNVLKVAMLLCAAESNDMVLKASHLERSIELVSAVEEGLPAMIREAKAGQTHTQEGLVQAVLRMFDSKKQISKSELCGRLSLNGFDSRKVNATVDSLINNKAIDASSDGRRLVLTLLVDPNSYL